MSVPGRADSSSPPPAPHEPARAGTLALDGHFWRRAAKLGAARAPSWFVRWSPPVIGAAISLAVPRERRAISAQLARARGRVGLMRDAVDVVRTFANFASCLTEVLSTGSKNDCPLASTVHRGPRVDDLLASAGGLIFVTAHTAGWERLGALLAGEHRKRVLLVMRRERDEQARELQDATRRVPGGVSVLHVGDDPFASLPLMHHLRGGGAVAMQIDRVPPGMTGHAVQLFGRPALIPEGPLRLAQLSGAPLVPVFSARRGHRRYSVHVHEPIRIARRAGATAVDAAAQQIADALGQFVSTHPTQWFSFRE